MFVLCLLACLALTSAAPQLRLHFHHGSFPDTDFDNNEDIFGRDVFDARRFWQGLETEMNRFEEMLGDFYKHFPTMSTQAEIQGDEYVVTQTLNGFDEEDIKVKAREGVLMIQAVHKSDDGSQRSHIDLKTLPAYVNVNGSWTFGRGVLKIVFPLNYRPDDATTPAVTETTTDDAVVEDKSREEMDRNDNNNNQDADVGLETSNNKETEILTNVIPSERNTVEATTYAVDLKNEVEFVPIKY